MHKLKNSQLYQLLVDVNKHDLLILSLLVGLTLIIALASYFLLVHYLAPYTALGAAFIIASVCLVISAMVMPND